MASWVSANMSNLLPGEVDTIIDLISSLSTTVQIPLELTISILNVAKTVLVSLDAFDPATILRDTIEAFKNDILGAGFYICDMWDYSILQLVSVVDSDHGPDSGFNYNGNTFEDSFRQDLLDSFEDENDLRKPTFTGKCAMLVLVIGRGTLDEIGIDPDESNFGETFKGFQNAIGQASYGLQQSRYRLFWLKAKQVAENQPSDKVAARVNRVQTAFKLFSFLSNEDLDGVETPFDQSSGRSFFEDDDLTINDISYKDDILPVIESVENAYKQSEYPDWRSVRLIDIYPELVELVDIGFDAVLSLFVASSTILESVVELINSIQAKLDWLDSIISLIDQLIEDLDDMLNTTGLHALFVSSNNGISDLKTKLENATNVPFDGNGFFAGMSILAGGDATTVLQTLFSPLIES
jgi:hypothetical protein